MKIYAPILLFVISIFLSLLIVKEYFFDAPQCAINTDCATCAKANGCAWCLNKSACVPTDRMGYPLYRDCTDKDLVTFENNCNRVSTSDMRTTTISTEGTGSTGNGNANWADRIFDYNWDGSDNSALNLGLNTWLENNESPYPTESSDGDSWNKYENNETENNKWWENYWDDYWNFWHDASGNDASGNSYDSNDASGNQTCSSKKNCKSCAILDDCAWCTDTNTCVVTERGRSVENNCSDMKLLSFVNDCPTSSSSSIYSSSENNSGFKWGDYIGNKLYDANGHDLSCLNNQGNSKITGRPCKDLDPAYLRYIKAYNINDLDPSGNEWSSNNVPGNKFLKNANGKDVSCITNRHGRSKISGLLCRYTDSSGNIQERFGVEKFGNYKPTNIIQKIISEQLKRNGLPSIETFTGSITETIRNAIRLK